jgi:hypothetical protein
VLEAGTELTGKAGGNWIKLDPSGIHMGGGTIHLGGGGSPGNGSGATPQAPDKAIGVDEADRLAVTGTLYAAAATNIVTDAGGGGASVPTWDKEKSVKHLLSHAGEKSKGRCATYVREAIEAGGGSPLNRALNSSSTQQSAYGYGPILEDAGFTPLKPNEQPQKGDVVVIQPPKDAKGNSSNPSGHIAMFDGQGWVADFKHKNGELYPGDSYRTYKPPYTIYRRR